jgi:toxin FitB
LIVPDTNVISAFMQREIDPAVLTWLDAQPAESIWKTAFP